MPIRTIRKNYSFLKKNLSRIVAISGKLPDIALKTRSIGIFYE